MRPFRNAWMLEEIGLGYHYVNCKPWSKKAKAVHPLGKVPALLVEQSDKQQFILVESAAINTFLGDVAREIDCNKYNLVPPPATQLRAKYDSLTSFIMAELDFQALWIHRKHCDMKDFFGDAPVAVLEAERQFGNALDALENEINFESGYCLQCGFSACDILLSNCLFWAQQIGWLAKLSNESPSSSTFAADERPKALSPKLETYLANCRGRRGFIAANELRKDETYKEEEKRRSKI